MGFTEFLSSSGSGSEDVVDVSDVGSAVEVGSAVAIAGGAAAANSATAGIATLLPLAGKVLVQDAVQGHIRNIAEKKFYQPLKMIAEERDTEQAGRISLARACAGICTLADPLFEDDIPTLAHSDPAKLNELIEQTLSNEGGLDREQLRRLEAKFSVIFLGEDVPDDVAVDIDPNDSKALIQELKELFNTDDREEAIALFMLYEQFLSDVTDDFIGSVDQETLSDEERAVIESLETTVEQMESQIGEFRELYIRLSIENQQFRQLTTHDFEGRDTFRDAGRPPLNAWRTGYDFAELAERTPDGDPYYFERPLPDDCALAADTGTAETVSEALVERLYSNGAGQNLILTGTPGMGKSHLCKLAAQSWFERGYGEVFYRESGRSGKFTDTAELKEGIKQAQSDRGGHVLVVVEDATRDQDGANQIFDVMEAFRGLNIDVTFLLDSRVAEWNEYKNESAENTTRLLNDNSTELLEYTTPEITLADCENARQVFNQTTTGTYDPPAERLYASVYSDHAGRGELLAVVDTLIRDGSFGQAVDRPLAEDAATAHRDIWEEIDLDDAADQLYYDVVVAATLLTGAEVGVRPSLLYALADDTDDIQYIDQLLEGDSRLSQRRSGPVPRELNETFLFGLQPNAQQYRSRHPTWATSFLAWPATDDGVGFDALHKVVIKVVTKMAGLADHSDKRRAIRQQLAEESAADTEYIDQFDQQPDEMAERLLRSVHEYGTRAEAVRPLVDAPEKSGFGADSTVFDDGIAAEAVPDACSERLRFQLLLIYAQTDPEGEGSSNEYESIQRFVEKVETQVETALDRSGQDRIRAEAQRYLSRVAARTDGVEWARVNDHYQDAIAAFSDINDFRDVAATQRERASAAAEAYGPDWQTIERYHKEAITTFRDHLDDSEGVATCYRQLAEVAAEDPAAGWDDVNRYYDKAVTSDEQAGRQRNTVQEQQRLASQAITVSETESATGHINAIVDQAVQTESVAYLVQLTERVQALRSFQTSIETVTHKTYQKLISTGVDILQQLLVDQSERAGDRVDDHRAVLLNDQRAELWSEYLLLFNQTLTRDSEGGAMFLNELSLELCTELTRFCLRVIHQNIRINSDESSDGDTLSTAVGILARIDLHRPAVVRDVITQYQRETDLLIADLLQHSIADGILDSTDEHVDRQLGAPDECFGHREIEPAEARQVASNLWDPFLKTILIIADADPVMLSVAKLDDKFRPLLTRGAPAERMSGMALFGLLRWTSDPNQVDIQDVPNTELGDAYGLPEPAAIPLSSVHTPDTMPIEPLLWRFTLGLNPAVPEEQRERFRYATAENIPAIVETYTHTGIRGLYDGQSTLEQDEVIEPLLDALPPHPESPLWDAINTEVGRDLRPEQWNRVVSSLPTVEELVQAEGMSAMTVVSVIRSAWDNSANPPSQWYPETYLTDVEGLLTADETTVRELLLLPFQSQQLPAETREDLIDTIVSYLDSQPSIEYRAAEALYTVETDTETDLSPQVRSDIADRIESLVIDSTLEPEKVAGGKSHSPVPALWILIEFQRNTSTDFDTVFKDIQEQVGTEIRPDQLGYLFKDVLYAYSDEEAAHQTPALDRQSISSAVTSVVEDESLDIEQRAQFLKPMLELHPNKTPLVEGMVYPIFEQFLSAVQETLSNAQWTEIPDLVLNSRHLSTEAQSVLTTEELLQLSLSVAANHSTYASEPFISAVQTTLTDDVIDRLQNEHPDALSEIRAELVNILGSQHTFENTKEIAGDLLQQIPRDEAWA
jgi:hypothetical protein